MDGTLSKLVLITKYTLTARKLSRYPDIQKFMREALLTKYEEMRPERPLVEL